MTHHKTYKFKLVPTKSQQESFNSWLGTTRFVYNLCLDYKKQLYQDHNISITKGDIQRELTKLRKEHSWIGGVHSQTLQDVTDRLFKSYDNFFRRVKKGEAPGFPRFARRDSWSSFAFKQGVKVHPNTNRVKLPKIGAVKFRKSQDILGVVKTANVKKECDGFYICITAEIESKPLPKIDKMTGFDLGVKDLLIGSDGVRYENPRTLKRWENRLIKAQRELSRKKKGSNNRKKSREKIRKIHQKMSRIRRDQLHKITSKIISENQVIICEKLNTKSMMKNHRLAKHIADASWEQICSMLEYKSAWHGREFVQVNAHHTSQDCSYCGFRNKELTLQVREWTCAGCGAHHDRDINAAVNIRNRGIKKLQEAGHVFSTFGDIELTGAEAEEPPLHSSLK